MNVLNKLPSELLAEVDIPSSLPEAAVILPGGDASITNSAKDIFSRFAANGMLYYRGGSVVELIEESQILSLRIVKPAAFRSQIELLGKTYAWRSGRGSETVLKPTRCPEEMAKALLACHVARERLPHVTAVIGCPVLLESEGRIRYLRKGHDRETGILVTGGGVDEIEFRDAVSILNMIVAEFAFQTDGDRARALAMILTPALKLGGFIHGSVPCDVAEADQSQSGKTFRQRLTAAIYGERPTVITQRNGGVGSLDESFSAALVGGRPFIQLDNMRGKLASQHIESFLTGESAFACRLPGCPEVRIGPEKFFIQLTSNGVECTKDFANRSCIIRICKRANFSFKQYLEGDLLAHVRANQARFLGAVLAVVKKWIETGKFRSDRVEHDFREWAGILDWISLHLLKCGPLLAGHGAEQERVSNPNLTFVRGLALAIVTTGKLGVQLIASELYELAMDANLDVPGLRSPDEDRGNMTMGRVLGKVFGSSKNLEVDGFRIDRVETDERRTDGQGFFKQRRYSFSRLESPSHHTKKA